VEVLEGLGPGDAIVLAGKAKLSDGQPLRIANTP
jgi:hypothetical protein